MMKPPVAIIDYGVGNLLSVARALEHIGAKVNITSDPNTIATAERVVFPGVGTYATAMQALLRQGLIEAILQFADSQRPFLGICLGMQMMLDSSEEFGHHKGLGLIAGEVRAIPVVNLAGEKCKVPHIGWSRVTPADADLSWENTVLNGVKSGSFMYFVHSYHAITQDPRHMLADTHYNQLPLAAVIHKDHLTGCQFHPEKSGEAGLKILRNFMAL